MTTRVSPGAAHEEGAPRSQDLSRGRALDVQVARGGRWYSTDEAAAFLGMPVRVLRDTLTERAKVVGEFTEARFDGIVGRRIGRRWKVWLSNAWIAPEGAAQGNPGGATLRPAESTGHGGKESPHGRA
jgi:hypothetical protein